jgi:hypothetical protein
MHKSPLESVREKRVLSRPNIATALTPNYPGSPSYPEIIDAAKKKLKSLTTLPIRESLTMKLLTVLALITLSAISAFAGNKSHVPGSRDGTYVGSTGSSHKGSHYVNPSTGDHYRDRKHGVPY